MNYPDLGEIYKLKPFEDMFPFQINLRYTIIANNSKKNKIAVRSLDIDATYYLTEKQFNEYLILA